MRKCTWILLVSDTQYLTGSSGKCGMCEPDNEYGHWSYIKRLFDVGFPNIGSFSLHRSADIGTPSLPHVNGP